jgi:hypothetical protein
VTETPLAATNGLDESIRIWRYIDLAKFLDLLGRSHIYLPRLDKLQRDDPFEGNVPDGIFSNSPLAEHITKIRALVETTAFVSCWHQNDHESVAMWKIYSDEGLAIQSTVGRLARAVNINRDWALTISAVRYGDRWWERRTREGHMDIMGAVVTKREAFEYEREIRAVCIKMPPDTTSEVGEPYVDLNFSGHPTGLYVPVNVATLVERVYVSPGKPRWFKELVLDLMGRMDADCIPVESSVLDDRPDLLDQE